MEKDAPVVTFLSSLIIESTIRVVTPSLSTQSTLVVSPTQGKQNLNFSQAKFEKKLN